MHTSISTAVRMFALFAVVLLSMAGVLQAQSMDQTLHVDKGHSAASDNNSGTSDQPLRTVQEAVDRVLANKRSSTSTHVIVHPGVYRESVVVGNNSGQNDTTPALFEAQQAGTVTISGADVLSNWQQDGSYYVHDWHHDISGGSNLKERQEIVAVNGKVLTQVASRGALSGSGMEFMGANGTFYVDDSANKLYINPVENINPSTATIEAGVREHLWNQKGESQLTIDGFIFEYAVTAWGGGEAAVRFSHTKNVTIRNSKFRWTNWQGLYVGDSENFRITNSSMNHNGGQGWGTWYVKGWYSENTETSYNNWRGDQGDHHGWNVGNKLMAIHDGVVKNHVSRENMSRGLWLDYDMEDIELDNLTIVDNHLDGVWFEANQGPITMTNSEILRNGKSGLRTTYTSDVTIDGNVIGYNAYGDDVILNDSQVIVDGGGDRDVQNFETGETMYPKVSHWTITNNTFIGTEFNHPHANGPTLIDTDVKGEDWELFVSTLTADNNTYYHADREAVFGYPEYEDLTLEQWSARTGEDQNSQFTDPGSIDDIDAGSPSGGSDSEPEPNERPVVTIDSPVAGDTFVEGETVAVLASASDTDGSVDRVEFLVDNAVVDEDGTNDFTIDWTPDASGEFTLVARAIDDAGDAARSEEITISVESSVADEDGSQDDGNSGDTDDQDEAGSAGDSSNDNRVGTETSQTDLPREFSLEGNYPNPFNPTTNIVFNLPATAQVSVQVYDMLGRQVMQLPVRQMSPGAQRSVQLDAAELSSGTYLYRLVAETQANTQVVTGRMTMIK